MKTYLTVISFAFLLAGCASYSPVQHLGGERHQTAAALESCTFDILTFPVNPKNTSIAGGINELNIKAEQVYSIESTYWMYLWPLVSHRCIYFNMNSKYTAEPSPKTNSSTQIINAPLTPTAPTQPSAADTNPGQISGNMDADFNACDDLMRMERSQCRKKVYNYYRDLEKQKKK